MKKKPVITLLTSICAASTCMCANAHAALQSPENPEAAADSIAVSTYGELEELVVEGVRPIVTTDGATTVYNVDEDPSSSGVTLLDMLRKVPMISVDGEDKILLKGESNFKILVNGKEDPSLSANASRLFKMMPANAVSKIEVITEPGAKYDAEGTGGIINLITIRNKSTDGVSGGLSGYFTNRMTGGSANTTAKFGSMALSANIDYANGRMFSVTNRSEDRTIYYDSENRQPTLLLDNNTQQKMQFDFLGAGLKFSWDISPADLLTINGNFNRTKGDVKDFTDNATAYTPLLASNGIIKPGKQLYSYRNKITGGMTNLSASGMLSYQHTFPGDRNDLVVSYLFSYGHNLLETLTENLEAVNYPVQVFIDNDMLNIDREHTAQIDYANNFNASKHLLETGAKAVIRRNGADGIYASGNDLAAMQPDAGNRTDMTQLQDIYAIYGSYTGTFGNWTAKGGLRFEHTRMGNRYHSGDLADFSHNLNDLVPNAAISYNFSPMQTLRMAYQMRIARPTIMQVTPFVFAPSPTMIREGNPNLKSEQSNQISLTYSNFGGVIGGNIGLEFTSIDNLITDYTYMRQGLRVETYGNIGKKRSGAAFGYLAWTIIPRMTLGVNARLDYTHLKSISPFYKNHGWTVDYGANWAYSTITGFKFSAYGGQSTRRMNLQGYYSGYHYYGIGVAKSFLSDKSLEVGVNASNFLESEMSYPSVTNAHDFSSHRTWYNRNWTVGVNISWTFGTRQNVKETSAEIVNDDHSTAGGNKQGGL